jgi:hypothetical protein
MLALDSGISAAHRSVVRPYRPLPRPLKQLRYACRPMTVCIAAMADTGKSMVLICDGMITAGAEFSGDAIADKLYPLSDRFQWWAMISGDDITRVVPVIDLAIEKLVSIPQAKNTVQEVERAVVSAYQEVRLQRCEDCVLSPIGMTLHEYKSCNPRDPYLSEEMRRVDLGCQILVAGFDWAGDGHILLVENPGVPQNLNPVGFGSIGSGSFGALGMLYHHSVNYGMELARVLYHALEAKFMAESAIGVGKHTTVKVIRAGVPDPYAATGLLTDIRAAWESDGKPRVPMAAIEALRRELKSHPSGPLTQ